MKSDNFNDLAELVSKGLASKGQMTKVPESRKMASEKQMTKVPESREMASEGQMSQGLALKEMVSEGQMKDMSLIVAVDGMSSALKTTLSEKLSAMFDGAVIHCDDFFLPLEFRTQERLAEPGGNIHYERMKAEVIDKLPDELEYYTKFDCSKMAYSGRVEVLRKPLYIVEGAYSMHPYFGKYYDMSIFMKVSEREQLERLRQRNSSINDFLDKWIPLEKNYNKCYKIEDNSDIVVDTTDWRFI